jgi:hypothetical protein
LTISSRVIRDNVSFKEAASGLKTVSLNVFSMLSSIIVSKVIIGID